MSETVRVGQIWRIVQPHNQVPGALATFTVTEIQPPFAWVTNGQTRRKIMLDRLDRENYKYYRLMKDVK
jgi:hypothetical protein